MDDSSCEGCCTCTNSGELFEKDLEQLYLEENEDTEKEDGCSGSES